KHYSYWFAENKNYPQLLEWDREIRDFVERYIQKNVKNVSNYGGIGHIEIRRKTDLVQINIHTGFPDLLIEEQSFGISQMKIDLGKKLGLKSQNLRVNLISVTQPYGEPKILAEHVALQLRNRVPFRRTMKKAIELIGRTTDRGIKIQIAGRLNGSEMARVEWAREGRVPLQIVKAGIKYCCHPAQTIYGVLGIKIWIFRDTH
ncbi:hypothetical protein KP509_07G056500, partial [Ceratopteris richardii]